MHVGGIYELRCQLLCGSKCLDSLANVYTKTNGCIYFNCVPEIFPFMAFHSTSPLSPCTVLFNIQWIAYNVPMSRGFSTQRIGQYYVMSRKRSGAYIACEPMETGCTFVYGLAN